MEQSMTTPLVPAPALWRNREELWRDGDYPESALSASPQTLRLVFLSNSCGVAADQYRTVAKRLELQSPPERRRLLVTSPGPRDGKSLSAVNLAWALSERGRSVILIELDLRKPTFNVILGGSPAQAGIEGVLRGEAIPQEAIFRIRSTSLHVASVDKPQQIAARLIQSKRLPELLEWANQKFDWVVIDSPPVFPVSDTIELVSHSDPVLLVIRARSTHALLAKRAIEALGGSLKFVLFNGSDVHTGSPYYYTDYKAALP
jgi:capsular exopolysaccharide synthesis family protein